MKVADEPRPYGRQPVALRGLAESLPYQLERELRGAAVDSYVFVKAFWLRAGADRYGWPDYRHAYIWVAPVVMNPKLCEVIEPFVAKVRGVEQTGHGGSDPKKPLRPFVFGASTSKPTERVLMPEIYERAVNRRGRTTS